MCLLPDCPPPSTSPSCEASVEISVPLLDTRGPVLEANAGTVEFAALGEPDCLLYAAAHLDDKDGAAFRGELRDPGARRAGGAEAETPTCHVSGSNPGCQVWL